MTAIRFEQSAMTNAYVAVLADLGVKLPVRPSRDNIGTLCDSEGKEFMTVDTNGQMTDNKAVELAEWIAISINTCGGYLGELVTP